MSTGPDLGSLLVVGTGLIGTSVGLAASAAGVAVWLHDRDPRHVETAARLGAGRPWPGATVRVDHVVVCVPPASVAATVRALADEDVARSVSDTAGSKSQVLVEVEGRPDVAARFVGGHPMAGREHSGPWHARADLFVGRPWILTPTPTSSPGAVRDAGRLAELCGARVVVRTAAQHDRAVAAVSHLPQLVASALGARLAELDAADVELAGQAVRDMTRIAASDPGLWSELVASNAAAVDAVLGRFVDDLSRVRAALVPAGTGAARSAVGDLVRRGNQGAARLPGKHGGPRRRFGLVMVAVADRPGELARLLTEVAATGVNVEDVAVDHAPGQEAGVVQLAVAPEDTARVRDALTDAGWGVDAT